LLGELQAQLRGGGPLLAQVLDSLAEAVTIRDRGRNIIYANRVAVELMGLDSPEEVQRRGSQAIFGDYVVLDEHGRELTIEDVPSMRMLSGEAGDPLVLQTVKRSTGEVAWRRLKAAPLRDEDGEMMAVVTVIEDITAEKTAELRDRFLARASETLMSSLDYEETLRNVAWLSVPEIADWCAVDLLDERGARQRVVVAHRDPAKLELAQQARRFEPEQLDPDRGLGRVLRTGLPELYSEIPDELLVQAAPHEEHLRLLRAVGMRSVLLVPLRAGGRTFGAMTLVSAESLRRFSEDDKRFAQRVASRAAIAVENARLATARRQIAETLQRSLLPDVVPRIEGWEIATMYRAGSAAQEVEVGGDFYDFFPTDRGWIVLVGDVTGKGVAAATMTSLVRHGARFLSKHEESPSAILAGLDEALRDQAAIALCSALCLRLEPDQVTVSSAGHPLPLIVGQDGAIREISVGGPILGAWGGGRWVDQAVPLTMAETLIAYTDGVTDARGRRERFGLRRLREVFSKHARKPPAELLAELEAALDRFQVQARADDTAALALRLSPVEVGSASDVAGEIGGRTLEVG
jgi:PAS domain S-box-containing protein